jgi:gluconate kinase
MHVKGAWYMSIHKLFILGRPGSGKSIVAQLIHHRLQRDDWLVKHLFDYPLLQKRFQDEIDNNIPEKEKRFRSRGPEVFHGFDVMDLSAFDDAVKDLVNEVITYSEIADSYEKSLLVVEFARKDYRNALSFFGSTLLQDAHFLYIHSPLELCMERIHARVSNHTEFDHYVSDDIMQNYYRYDDWLGWCQFYFKFLSGSGVRFYRYQMTNNGSFEQLVKAVDDFLSMSFLLETEKVRVASKSFAPIESGK